MDTLHQMRQLIALAERGNYRTAGLRLGGSHAAVSQTITRLEKDYGVSLFEKKGGATVPTIHGQRLVEAAGQLLSEAEQVKDEINSMKQLDGQTLIIGADPIVCDSLMAPVLARLLKSHPKLKFRVVITHWAEMESQLRDKIIQIYVGVAHNRRPEGIIFSRMWLTPPIMVCNAEHPLAQQKKIMFSDILRYRAMLSYVPDWLQKPWLPEISGFYSSTDQVHEFLGQNFVESESMGTLRELLLQTDAIAVMPETLVREDIKDKTLKKLNIEGFPFVEKVKGIVAHLEGYVLSPAATATIKTIHDLVESDQNRKTSKNNAEEKDNLMQWPLTMGKAGP